MKAEIIAIGTELLMGQIANTNAQYIAKELNEMNIGHYYQTVVGNNPDRMKQAIRTAADRSNVVIVMGGLGPTQDDMTKQVLAELVDEPLILEEETAEGYKDEARQRGMDFNKNNLRMALVFENGQIFQNPVGQALGTAIEKEGTIYIALPGPPNELKGMFTQEVKPYLLAKKVEDDVLSSRYLNFHSIGESSLSTKIEDLIDQQTNPTIAIYINPEYWTVTVRLTAFAPNEDQAHKKLDELQAEIIGRLESYYYGEGLDYHPQEAVRDELLAASQTIAFAESLTGGLATANLVEVSGASQVFKGSMVAYDSQTKNETLGVPKEILEKEGMVSEACAQAMAEQACQLFDSDWALSYTGVAGPDSMEGQPVGKVFVGLAHRDQSTEVFEFNLEGNRTSIRQASVYRSYFKLLKRLKRQDAEGK